MVHKKPRLQILQEELLPLELALELALVSALELVAVLVPLLDLVLVLVSLLAPNDKNVNLAENQISIL
jgi:hypothetical protein